MKNQDTPCCSKLLVLLSAGALLSLSAYVVLNGKSKKKSKLDRLHNLLKEADLLIKKHKHA